MVKIISYLSNPEIRLPFVKPTSSLAKGRGGNIKTEGGR